MAAALLLTLQNSGLAQVAEPSQVDKDKAAEAEEVIVLSPFVVDAEENKGYQAVATLAGSRVRTDLKDVSQSITVVTKSFLDDLGAVDVNDVLAYTTGAEGTRSFTAVSGSTSGAPTDSNAINPKTGNRLRGLVPADIKRDYFSSISNRVGFDSYNLDEVTIVRGPNSILAGVGSPSGIINYSPQLAGLSKSHNRVSYQIGSYGDQRATLNSNHVLVPGVLAYRVAGLWAEQKFKQDPSYNDDKRIYFTTTYQPYKSTTVRVGYEIVDMNANWPNSITPEDGISQWIALGKPVYDSQLGTQGPGLSGQTFDPTVVFNKDGTVERAYRYTGRNFFQANQNNLPLHVKQRMHDNTYIPLDSMNLNPSTYDTKQKTINFSIEQRILPGLDAKLDYIHEDVRTNDINLSRAEYSTYSIDPNKYLPDGSANPHFLETYFEYRGLDNSQKSEASNQIIRGTLAYDLNLTKVNKWLGRYKFTAFAEHGKNSNHVMQFNLRDTGRLSTEDIRIRYYMGGTAANGYQAQAAPRQPGLVQAVPFGTGTLNTFYSLKSDTISKTKLDSSAAVVQAFFWDDRIVALAGIRRDEQASGFANQSAPAAVGGRDSLFATSPAYGEPIANNTTSLGLVVHPLKWLSVHYNRSENFTPNAGSIDLDGNKTPFPTGLTKDIGFSVDLLDGKLHAKVNWFNLDAKDAPSSAANGHLAQWGIPWADSQLFPAFAAQAGIPYQRRMAAGLVTGDSRLANAYTSNQVSKGLEIELAYDVTKNWRIMAGVSKQDAKESGIAAGLTEFIEERLAYWSSIPDLWTNQSVDIGWGQKTGQSFWNEGDQIGNYLKYKSAEGKTSTQLAKWSATAMTNYAFTDGFLKGFNAGGGARLINSQIIGHPVFLDAQGRVTGLDLDNPYKNSAYIGVDAWVGYTTKILNDKYTLKIQLNGRDLQESGSFRPIQANVDGSHPTYRIQRPRTFYLNTTLEF